MPIDSKHPEYTSFSSKWERCRDAHEGSDAIKAKGEKYLPRLYKQKTREYQAYKARALFYAITSKTVGALVGMATVREPVVNFPSGMEAYYTDDKGIKFNGQLSKIESELLLMGRIGGYVDMPITGGDPFPLLYTAESMINWRIDPFGKLEMIILEEWYDTPGKDEYEVVKAVRYRKLSLRNGVYTVEVMNAKGESLAPPVTPQIGGKTLDYIPFWIANPIDLEYQCEKPPMIDIVDINISHYQSSADLEHGRHFTALPTPYVTGVTGGSELAIGSTAAWALPDAQSKVGYLEFTGQGLQSLEKALAEKQSQLASLSARIMDNSKRGSEASDVVRLRYTSETASLVSVTRSAESLLITLYKEIAKFKELNPDEVDITLNKEFLDSKLKPKDVVDMVDSFLKGGISSETLVFNLRRGDVIPVSANDSEESAALDTLRKEKSDLAKAQSSNSGKPPTNQE